MLGKLTSRAEHVMLLGVSEVDESGVYCTQAYGLVISI